MEKFDFAICEEIQKAIRDMGYESPTPIQEMTIPPLLSGRDVIGQAQTGTGKTAAFGIPMIERTDAADLSVQGLVLCPTRELAVQTAGEIAKLGKYRAGLRTLAIYGGQPYERQLGPLKAGVQVVVGTPGRVMDHLNRGTLDLSKVKFAVLDEADEMLDMGFREDIETILGQTNADRQTALFSATMPFAILSLAKQYLKEPEFLRVENKALTVEAVRQTYIPIRSFHKPELLARLLVRDNITRALVFLNTKLGVEEVVTRLQAKGFAAAGLHGDMRQIERDSIMARFKSGLVGILVATDVAARGLDIENVEAVFNYDIPLDVEYYVHRIGRTGRAGKEGRAYTFVVGRETARMWDYRKITKAAILCEQPPSGEDIRAAEEARMLENVKARAEGELNESALNAAKTLLMGAEPEKAVAALIEMLENASGEKIDPKLDIKIPEPPKPAVKPLPQRQMGNRGTNQARFPARAPYARADAHFPREEENAGGKPVRDRRFDARLDGDAPKPSKNDRFSKNRADGNRASRRNDRVVRENEVPKTENRFERRRRQFGDLPETDGAAEKIGAENGAAGKPYRPWEESPRRNHKGGRDGAIHAKDSLPRRREDANHGKKSRPAPSADHPEA